MDNFEELLRDTLRRENPPEGFERRVLAAAAPRRFSWRPMMAIAAMLAVAAGAGWQVEQSRRDHEAGEAAKAKLEQALRVTSTKLQKIRQTVDSMGEGY